jgi:predicted transcriptional regulator
MRRQLSDNNQVTAKMSDTTEQMQTPHGSLLRMTADVVAAYVGKNLLAADEISGVINLVYSSLAELKGGKLRTSTAATRPAVPIRRSVMPDYIVCLEDGKKLKMLKRHIRTTYGLSPEQYRAKWGLPPDYPMVAPNYAQQRSSLAKKIGLGRDSGRR